MTSAAEPRMAEALLCGQAIAWPNLQQTENEVLCALCNAFPCLLRKAQVSLHDLPVQLVEHIVEKRQGAAQDNIADDAY